ncbi:uncharacterized protein LOC142634893 [Castanea sativa]|uniref:uncharacterized protein LOC142634893 n=1 Tax=Castanea sativa TaxID=21020 RepID=UPI003F64BDAE
MEAILRIPLSRRPVQDTLMWHHTKNKYYSVRSGYYIACGLQQQENGGLEGSGLKKGEMVWPKLWKYKVPNKIKAIGWRICQNILPTRENLFHRKVVEDRGCEACKQEVESIIHVMWECGVAQDVYAGSRISLQKCPTLMGTIQDPSVLVQKAETMLHDYHDAQSYLSVPLPSSSMQQLERWKPRTGLNYKINVDATIFPRQKASGFGVVIRNERGETMAVVSARRPLVQNSDEAEALACRKAVEVAVDLGFRDVTLEGNNISVRTANTVAHSLAKYAGLKEGEMVWLEEGPPPARDALYS